MTTKALLDGAGASFNADLNLALGRLAATITRSVNLCTEDKAAVDLINTNIGVIAGYVDGLEALIGATNTKMDTLNTAVASTTPSPVIPECPNFETIAASQTDQVMGSTGAIGDILSYIKIIPATTSPGAVSVKDGSGSSITVFTGGGTSVMTLIPFDTAWAAPSVNGAWKITTGANVSAIAFGRFT